MTKRELKKLLSEVLASRTSHTGIRADEGRYTAKRLPNSLVERIKEAV
jgi:hypothetical protein